MGTQKKIESEMVKAAKNRDKDRLSSLRLIKAALHNKRIDLMRELKEEDELQVLSSMAKQRKESIEQFEKGGRSDLVEKEQKELQVIQEFLPDQMSEEDLGVEIENAIREVGASSPRDMGKVMKVLMPKLTGKADGKVVSEKVKSRLSS